MYLIMEFCAGGDLAHFIRRCKRVPEAIAHGLMLQLAAGLREMWSHNLVHVSFQAVREASVQTQCAHMSTSSTHM